MGPGVRLTPGASVDRYVVARALDEPGPGRVYQVRGRRIGAMYRMRVVEPEAEASARLLAAIEAQAGLDHPNVLAVNDLVELDGALGLVTEDVSGPTLAEVLAEEEALAAEEVPGLFGQLCDAVQAAHAAGVVHGRLGAADVHLADTAAGVMLRVAEFGVAAALAGGPAPTPTTDVAAVARLARAMVGAGAAARLRAALDRADAGGFATVAALRAAVGEAGLAAKAGDSAAPIHPAAPAPRPWLAPEMIGGPGSAAGTVGVPTASGAGAPAVRAPDSAPARPPEATPPLPEPEPPAAQRAMSGSAAAPAAPAETAPHRDVSAPLPSSALDLPPDDPTQEELAMGALSGFAAGASPAFSVAAAPPRPAPLFDDAQPTAHPPAPAAPAEPTPPLVPVVAPHPPYAPSAPRGVSLQGYVVVGALLLVALGALASTIDEQATKIHAADAELATLATALERPWLSPPEPLATALRHTEGRLLGDAHRFEAAPTARDRVAAARALVRAVRVELAAEAGKLPTADARLALDELEPIEAQVREAETALGDAGALRDGWSTAAAATLGWVDAAVPTGGAPLASSHPLSAFEAAKP